MVNSSIGKIALWLLTGCGVFQIGMGFFFIRLRPTLLPEDERFIGLSLDALSQVSTTLPVWLDRVFVVLGGHAIATGLLIILATILLRSYLGNLRMALALILGAGLASVVLMSAVNFSIHSGFRWLLILPALAWTTAALLLIIELRRSARKGRLD